MQKRNKVLQKSSFRRTAIDAELSKIGSKSENPFMRTYTLHFGLTKLQNHEAVLEIIMRRVMQCSQYPNITSAKTRRAPSKPKRRALRPALRYVLSRVAYGMCALSV